MSRRAPVLGTRDLISPRGQYTAELLDERGRVVHRVVAENTILDCSKRLMDQAVRDQYQSGTTNVGVDTDYWWLNQAATPKEGPLVSGMEWWHRWLYLSDSTLAVDATEWAIPGTMLGVGWTGQVGGQTPYERGSYNQAQSYRDRTTRRWVMDFTASQAVGTIGCFGLGNIINDYSRAGAFPTPSYVNTYRGGQPSTSALPAGNVALGELGGYMEAFPYTGSPVNLSAQFLDTAAGAKFWYALGGQGIFYRDLANTASRPGPQTLPTITGPTYSTIGASVGQAIGLTIIGTDMWLGYGVTLKKCAIPTDATLSVTTTYATVSGFTDAAILDLTTDGTSLYLLGSTKVFVVNPATGAVTSSWVHGKPNVSGIEYSASPVGYLYVSSSTAIANYYEFYSGGNGNRILKVDSFTVAGTAGPYSWGNAGYDQYGTFGAGWSGWTGSFAGGWGGISFSGRGGNGGGTPSGVFRGPQAGSRALLGTPLVKDATKALRVMYDITFS